MFKLPAQLIINHVEELYQQVKVLLESGEDVVMDISDIEKVDTAGLQLLCVVQKGLIETGHKIAWSGSSEPLVNTAKMIGLNEFLQL